MSHQRRSLSPLPAVGQNKRRRPNDALRPSDTGPVRRDDFGRHRDSVSPERGVPRTPEFRSPPPRSPPPQSPSPPPERQSSPARRSPARRYPLPPRAGLRPRRDDDGGDDDEVDIFVLQNVDYGVDERDLERVLRERGVDAAGVVCHGGVGGLTEHGATVFVRRNDVRSGEALLGLNRTIFGPRGMEERVVIISVARRPVRGGRRVRERDVGYGASGVVVAKSPLSDGRREALGKAAESLPDDLFVLQNLPFHLNERNMREELARCGVVPSQVVLHPDTNGTRNNGGGANVFIPRQDTRSIDSLISLNRSEFGPPAHARALMVIPVDPNRKGEYTLCIVPANSRMDIDHNRVRALLPEGSIRDFRRIVKHDKLQFYVDIGTLRDFCDALLAPQKDKHFSIRAAPARGAERARAELTMGADGGGFGSRNGPPPPPPKGGPDLRDRLSRDAAPHPHRGRSPRREDNGFHEELASGAPGPQLRDRSPLPPHSLPRRGRSLSPRRDVSPPPAGRMRSGDFSPQRNGSPPRANGNGLRRDMSPPPSRRGGSPDRLQWDGPADGGARPRGHRSDVLIPRIVDDMTERSKEDYVRLVEDISDFNAKVLRENPAFLVVNLPFLDDSSDVDERAVKEASLQSELERLYPELQIVHVKLLDIRGAAAIVVVRRDEDRAAVLNGPRSGFSLGDRYVHCVNFGDFSIVGKAYGNRPEIVADLATYADSFYSRAEIKPIPQKGEEFFAVSGDPYNLLMVISLSGRLGRHGFKFIHSIDYSNNGVRPPRFGPPGHDRHEGGLKGPARGGDMHLRILVKGIPDGMYPAALAKLMKKNLGLEMNDWIDTEPGPEPRSAVFMPTSSRVFDALLTQDGEFLKNYRGLGSTIEVKPLSRGQAEHGREHGRAPSPRGVDFSPANGH